MWQQENISTNARKEAVNKRRCIHYFHIITNHCLNWLVWIFWNKHLSAALTGTYSIHISPSVWIFALASDLVSASHLSHQKKTHQIEWCHGMISWRKVSSRKDVLIQSASETCMARTSKTWCGRSTTRQDVAAAHRQGIPWHDIAWGERRRGGGGA